MLSAHDENGLVGLGCMRLSTELVRDGEGALQVLVAALNHGVTYLDTAPSYALGDWDTHHNERLIAKAMAAFEGDSSSVVIGTKGGLHREGTIWVPDGRARTIRESCERSLEALGRATLALYMLHTVDPRTPIATSARALANLLERGLVAEVGLCNVSLTELESALRVAPITTVQVPLSPFDDLAFRSGLVKTCRERKIRLLAHSPLGGPKKAPRLAKDPVLSQLATKHGASPQLIVIAWLYGLGIVPLPGARRLDTAILSARARRVTLAFDEEDWKALDERFPAAASAMGREVSVSRRAARSSRVTSDPSDEEVKGDVAVVMGLQGSGKSRYAEELVVRGPGYLRLNRDTVGGKLSGISRALDRALSEGTTHVVLDNTYLSRASRNDVIVVARRWGLFVRCIYVATHPAVAQALVVVRLVDRYDHLPNPEELRALSKHDPQAFPPNVLYRARRELEAPTIDEGFTAVEVIPGPASAAVAFSGGTRAGVAILAETVIRLSSAELAALADEHRHAAWHVFHWSMDPIPPSGGIPQRAVDRIGLETGIIPTLAVCAHGGGPPICWCRPPLTGLIVPWIRTASIDPSRTVLVGNSPAHRAMAKALSLPYSAR